MPSSPPKTSSYRQNKIIDRDYLVVVFAISQKQQERQFEEEDGSGLSGPSEIASVSRTMVWERLFFDWPPFRDSI